MVTKRDPAGVLSGDLLPWERQEGETDAAFAAFKAWLDSDKRQLKDFLSTARNWSARYHWGARAHEYDTPYYFHIDEFNPFTGGKTYAAELAGPFWRRAHREEWAAEAASSWRTHFRHDKVMKALRANRLLPGIEHVHVDVHHNFLSGFAHPSKKGYEAVWGGNTPDRMGSFDHYPSELVLLYVITLAAAELDSFGRMARRDPKLGLRDWGVVERDVREARLAASYFWFLGGEPTMFDRIETVHTPPGARDPKWGRPRHDPRTIKRVRYYADPMDRLVRLHSSFQELSTGLVYQSPFDRPDARFRH
jgi:hypothetical protein